MARRRAHQLSGDGLRVAGLVMGRVIARGRISLTPVHFDLTDRQGLGRLRNWDLEGMLEAAMTSAR